MQQIIIAVLVLAGLAFAQNQETAAFPGSIANPLVAKNRANATLTSDVTSSATAIPVTDGTQFRYPSVIAIDFEYIKICSISTNTLNVCTAGRGLYGTMAMTHTSGAIVSAPLTEGHINGLDAEVVAIETALGPNLANVLKTTGGTLTGPLTINQSSGDPLSVTGNWLVEKNADGNQQWGIGVSSSGWPYTSGTFAIKDATHNAERLVIDPTGKVGIGTAAPGWKLEVNGGTSDVYGGLKTDASHTATLALAGGHQWTLNALASGVGPASKFSITDASNSADRLTIDANGMVLVPNALRVERSTGSIGFYVTGTGDRASITSNLDNSLVFNPANASNAMVVTGGTGDVLVGATTDSGQRLQVVGGSAQTARLTAPSASGGTSLIFADGGTPTKYNWLIGAQYNHDNAFEITPSAAVGGSTFTTPVMSIFQNGRVLVGTNTDNGTDTLQVGGSVSATTFKGALSGNASTVTNGVYTSGSYSDPSWLTISKSKVGLGSVENTALSTWADSSNITTLGTISSGTIPAARISGTVATAIALAANGWNCAAGSAAGGVDASGNAESCVTIPKQINWGLFDPNAVLAANSYWNFWRAENAAATFTSISCVSDTGDAVINIINGSGAADMMASNLTCASASWSTQSTLQNNVVPAGTGIGFRVAGGTAHSISVSIKYSGN